MTWEGLSPPYSTIVADPPWPFRWDRNPLRYSITTVDDIVGLPVGELAADNAHLFLWVTRDLFREGVGVRVARSWGFEPVAEIIWCKRNFGTGSFPRLGHEPLLVCRRGDLAFGGPRNVHSVQDWKQTYHENGTNTGKGHSRKPAASFDLIESASPGPYVELFARVPRLGWDSWGKGYEIGASA